MLELCLCQLTTDNIDDSDDINTYDTIHDSSPAKIKVT